MNRLAAALLAAAFLWPVVAADPAVSVGPDADADSQPDTDTDTSDPDRRPIRPATSMGRRKSDAHNSGAMDLRRRLAPHRRRAAAGQLQHHLTQRPRSCLTDGVRASDELRAAPAAYLERASSGDVKCWRRRRGKRPPGNAYGCWLGTRSFAECFARSLVLCPQSTIRAGPRL